MPPPRRKKLLDGAGGGRSEEGGKADDDEEEEEEDELGFGVDSVVARSTFSKSKKRQQDGISNFIPAVVKLAAWHS